MSNPLSSVAFHPFDQKSTFICKFCGGKSCKHENWLTQTESAIKGLNSDWVSNNILAMQRPSSRLIKEFDVVQQFKEKGINAIFNLQEPGEHPFCGDGIHATSGFSYYPEEFSDHGIYFFNFGWKDMTAASTDVILRIVKQMSFSLTNGSKVAVHCHAGRGRTGLIIAAWLIFHDNMSAKDAVKHIRLRRKDAISKKSQERILYQFEKEVKESRLVFFSAPKYGLEEYLFHQKKLTALSVSSAERYVPKIVLIALERLETLMQSDICRAEDVLASFYSLNERESFKEPWGSNQEKFLKQFKERINMGNYEVSDIEDPRYLSQIILDFLDGFSNPAIEQRFILAIQSKIHETKAKLTKDIKDQFFKELNKKEFFLLECFARFFATLLIQDERRADQIVTATLRVCISLLCSKKRLDKLFLKRSLIRDFSQDDQVTYLRTFLLKWIENFNENFTEMFMLHKSPLHINERKIREKMIKKGIRVNTYLSKVLDAASKEEIARQEEEEAALSSSSIPELDEEKEAETPVTPVKRDALGIMVRERNLTESSTASSTINKKSVHKKTIKLIHCPEIRSATTRSSDKNNNSAISSGKNRTGTSGFPMITFDSQETSRRPESPEDDYGSARSKHHNLSLGGPRRSFRKVILTDKSQEHSTTTKLNIEKQYDNLFASKGSSKESLPQASAAHVGSIDNDLDPIQDLIDRFKMLSADKQDIAFQKLLEIQVSRNPAV